MRKLIKSIPRNKSDIEKIGNQRPLVNYNENIDIDEYCKNYIDKKNKNQ